jgi:hypothetical protein
VCDKERGWRKRERNMKSLIGLEDMSRQLSHTDITVGERERERERERRRRRETEGREREGKGRV